MKQQRSTKRVPRIASVRMLLTVFAGSAYPRTNRDADCSGGSSAETEKSSLTSRETRHAIGFLYHLHTTPVSPNR